MDIERIVSKAHREDKEFSLNPLIIRLQHVFVPYRSILKGIEVPEDEVRGTDASEKLIKAQKMAPFPIQSQKDRI